MDIKRYINNKWFKILVIAIISVLILDYWGKISAVIDYFFALLSPFIVGCGIAFVLSVPLKAIERRFFISKRTGQLVKAGRACSLAATIVFILGVIAVVIFMIVPQLTATVGDLVNNLSEFEVDWEKTLSGLSEKYPQMQDWLKQVDIDWANVSKEVMSYMKSGLGGVLDSTVDIVGNIIFGVFNFFIGFVFAIYILYNKETLSRQGKKLLYSYLAENKADYLIRVVRLSNSTFSSFLSGQCVEACILGFMFFITMAIMGLPYALLIGVLIAFTSLIPVFGAFIGCVLGMFLIVVTNPIDALVFLIVFIILQQLEENLIYPHVVGNSVGLPSIWVLVAVTLGGSLMGVIGMLIFIPITSVLYSLLSEDIAKRLEKRKIDSKKWND